MKTIVVPLAAILTLALAGCGETPPKTLEEASVMRQQELSQLIASLNNMAAHLENQPERWYREDAAKLRLAAQYLQEGDPVRLYNLRSVADGEYNTDMYELLTDAGQRHHEIIYKYDRYEKELKQNQVKGQ